MDFKKQRKPTKYKYESLDRAIEEYAGKALIAIALFVYNILKYLLPAIFYGLIQCKNINKKYYISILIVALMVPTAALNINILHIPTMFIPIIYVLAALILRGLIFSAEKYRFNKGVRKNGIMSDNHKYPRLKEVRYEGMRKIFVCTSCTPTSKFVMSVSKLANSLNTNITHFSVESKPLLAFYEKNVIFKRFFSKKFIKTIENILIFTDKKGKIPANYLRIEQFTKVFQELGLDVSVKEIEDTEYYTNIYFNTKIPYKNITAPTTIEEIKHHLKVNNLKISTDKKYDFKMNHKKPLGVKTFLEAWDKSINIINKKTIPIMMGINCETGEIAVLDMAKDFLHTIVAGETGAGKSIGLHNICASVTLSICSQIEKFQQSNIRALFCDPKGNELKVYRKLPYITYVDDEMAILDELENMVKEMTRRNNLFKPHDFITNIEEWNCEFPEKSLDYIVIVVDEIADYMDRSDETIKKRFTTAVVRLAQLSRSVGFRLVLTTQNPVFKVLSGKITANCATRIAFATSNKMKSRTILDTNDAAFIDEPGKFVFKNKKEITLHKAFMVDMKEKKEVFFRLKPYIKIEGEKVENETQHTTNSKLEVDIKKVEAHPDRVRIKSAYNLYNYYIKIQDENGKLPVKSRLMELTNLTEWMLRSFNDQLKNEGKVYIENNRLYVVNDIDELAEKRKNVIRGETK